jgi:hypothetical protein
VAVRPEFGPTLPTLLRSRGLSSRAQSAALVALIAIVAGAVLYIRAHRGTEQATVHGPPVFNVVYKPSTLQRVAPHDGELLRLQGKRRDITVVVAVRAVHLPPYPGGDAVGGYLPILAEQRERQLAALYGPLQIYNEGKARTNKSPGYQIGFGAGRAGHVVYGRDVYVFPQETNVSEGALVSLRQFVSHRLTAADKAFLADARSAYFSFTFGETAS